MKKTIAILLILAVVMTGVFAANVKLQGSVPEGSGTGGDENNPAGVSVWGKATATGNVGRLTDGAAVVTEALLYQDDPNAGSKVTEYYLVAYYVGNSSNEYKNSVTVSATPFTVENADENDLTVPVNVALTVETVTTDANRNVTGTVDLTVSDDNKKKANLTVDAKAKVLEKVEFAQFTLEWTPSPSNTPLTAGAYSSDVTITIETV